MFYVGVSLGFINTSALTPREEVLALRQQPTVVFLHRILSGYYVFLYFPCNCLSYFIAQSYPATNNNYYFLLVLVGWIRIFINNVITNRRFLFLNLIKDMSHDIRHLTLVNYFHNGQGDLANHSYSVVSQLDMSADG